MNLGFPEMLFLGLLALLLFGPKRMPEIGRQIGHFLAEFKRASNEFQSQLEDEVRQLDVEQDSHHSIAPPAPPEGSVAQTASSSQVSAQEQGANLGHQASASSEGPAPSPELPASSGYGTNGGDGAQGA